MATEFKIPELGENVTAGDVVRVLVKPGDTLAKDQAVLELETDKATIEVPSNVEGTVTEVKVKPGDKVKVGQLILTLGEGSGAKDAPAKADHTKGAAADADAAPTPKEQPAGAAEEGGMSQKAAAEPQKTEDGATRAAE